VDVHVVEYALHGSTGPTGTQEVPETQAAMQLPVLQTSPLPHAVPSGWSPPTAHDVAVSLLEHAVA
jgi:hypothetical protein